MACDHSYITGRSFIGLVLVTLSCTTVLADFTESFKPADDSSDAKAMLPGLWQQVGGLYKAGRGTSDNKYAMRLDPSTPTAETDLLKWDGSNKPLDFWYFNNEACNTGVLKVSLSCNGKDWEAIWSMKVADMQVNAYNVAWVRLPLNASCTTYAVRWDFAKGTNCYSSQYLDIDDITFPAQPPGKTAGPPPATASPGGGNSAPVSRVADGTAVTSEGKSSTAGPAATSPSSTVVAGGGSSSSTGGTVIVKSGGYQNRFQPVVGFTVVAGGLCLLLLLVV